MARAEKYPTKNSEPIKAPKIVSQSDMRRYKKPKFNPQPLKDKKWLLYGLIAVAGYFAYKKFIK